QKKLKMALTELIDQYSPKAAFIYCTCIVGIIGDDVDAVCREVEAATGIPVIPVHSEGFKGTKKDGYKAACDALFNLVRRYPNPEPKPLSINILGEFNIGGETWIIKRYYEAMGINVVSVITGDGRVEEVTRAATATLNVVQCSGSVTHLAKMMEEEYGIPYIRVSYFGIEDTSDALYRVAEFFKDAPEVMEKTRELILNEVKAVIPGLETVKKDLAGKRAALYVGGAFKAFSLIKALKTIGMDVVLAGSQTGTSEDYAILRDMCADGTVILDDANPLELAKYVMEKNADLFIGGV
ncbi:MAG TPA: nitrogenase iron-molybdenum cofactor biosynthesis protein NifE, partial [Desulfobacteraceae bacterium]|nr:nitrogenase iron-molybdenum cofactor biosynthesis protein NifE [Desulfobacteraceae bacterium]